MTREIIGQIECDYWAEKADPIDMSEIFDLARKALEQEPILDKVRAEIDKARFIDKDTRIAKNALASGLEVAMQIIDKYKGESEE
jgi:hypothetical protein